MALVQSPIRGLLVQDFSESPAMHLLGLALWDATVDKADAEKHRPDGLAWTLNEVLTKAEHDALHFPATDPRKLAQAAWGSSL